MLLEGAKKFEVVSFVGFGRELEVLFKGAMVVERKNYCPENVLAFKRNSSNTIK